MLYYLSIAGGRTKRFMPFSRILAGNDTQLALSRIWTRVSNSIFYDNNRQHRILFNVLHRILYPFSEFEKLWDLYNVTNVCCLLLPVWYQSGIIIIIHQGIYIHIYIYIYIPRWIIITAPWYQIGIEMYIYIYIYTYCNCKKTRTWINYHYKFISAKKIIFAFSDDIHT